MVGKVGGICRWATEVDCSLVVVGNNALRKHIDVLRTGMELVTAIHSSAIASRCASIDAAPVVMVRAIIGTEALLGCETIINCGDIVDLRCHIGNFAHMEMNAVMAGGPVLGPLTWMRAGSTLGYGAKFLEGGIVLSGEVVTG